MKDYYKILGIAKGATDEEIKKAYRKLAHQHHPDKAGGDESKFKEINEAYQILSDRKKRDMYDRFGTAEPMGGGFQGNPFPGFDFDFSQGNPFQGFEGFGGGQSYDVGDLGDIFETFFEEMGVRPKRRTYQRGSDLEMEEEISLDEAFRGVTRHLKLKTFLACSACNGQGADASAGFKQCTVCAGRGEIKEQRKTFFGSFAQVKPCGTCRGVGQIPNKVCSVCQGRGRVSGERDADIEILPGIHDSQIIKINGAGEAGERGTAAGDLYVRIHVRPHPIFERRGDDLLVKKELNVFDLLLGKKIEVSTMAGGKMHIEIPANYNLKNDFQISGEGMPRLGSSSRGDLFVNFIIKAPKKISSKAKKILEDLEHE